MLAALITLVPALRWNFGSVGTSAKNDQFAIDSCDAAVQIYFPCETDTRALDPTCLCEQYLWRVSCFENHASTSKSRDARATVENDMEQYCRAAGSIGTDMIQRKRQLHGRQIVSFISSIAGDVTSILSSASITIPTSVITSAVDGFIQTIAPPASTTGVTSPGVTSAAGTAISSGLGSAATPAASSIPTTSGPISTSNTQASSDSTSAPAAATSSSSGPSTGVIVGAVIGGVVALALIGILIMLILRHRRKRATTQTPHDKEASPTLSYAHPTHSPTLTNTSLATGPRPPSTAAGSTTVPPVPPYAPHTAHNEEKIAYHMAPQQPVETELATTSNVWEIDGTERHAPSELESPSTFHAYQPPWEERLQTPQPGVGHGIAGPGRGGTAPEHPPSNHGDEYVVSPVTPLARW